MLISSGHGLWHHGCMTQDTSKTFKVTYHPFVGMGERLRNGEEIDVATLAQALRACGGTNLRGFDDTVCEHIALHLEGKIQKRRGPKKLPDIERRYLDTIYRGLYRKYLHRIQACGLREPTFRQHVRPQNQKVWQGPPHEIACRLTARRCGLHPDGWKRILKRVSHSRNKP